MNDIRKFNYEKIHKQRRLEKSFVDKIGFDKYTGGLIKSFIYMK